MSKLFTCVLLSFVALVSGCKKSTTYEDPIQPSAPTKAATPPPPAGPDWGAMYKRIGDAKARSDLAIASLTKAKEEYAKAKPLSGAEHKAGMKKVEEHYFKAGDIFDTLKEEADRINPKLWDKMFVDFQKKWENLSSGEMKRALLTPR